MSTKRTTVDLVGIRCPMPIVVLNDEMAGLSGGAELEATADDPAFAPDVTAWCELTGHALVSLDHDGRVVTAVIRKAA